MDPISIGASAVSVAKLTYKVVKDLWDVYEYYQSIKQVNQTIHDLYSSVRQVTNICNLIENHVKQLLQGDSEEHDNEDLLIEIEAQLSSCAAAIHKINSKIKRVRHDKTNIVQQAARQIWLDMSEDTIKESKEQIQASVVNLQLGLQLVNLQVTYIAPKLANRTLLEKLDEIQKLLAAQDVDKGLQECADTYIERGTTLYERSVASSVGGFYTQSKPKAIAEWLEDMQALRLGESNSAAIAPDDDVLAAPSISQQTEETLATSSTVNTPSVADDDDDDEFAVEMVQTALASGRSFYAGERYKEAEIRLRECLALMQRLTERNRRAYDFDEIHLLLSLCAFYLYDSSTAEAALLSALERNAGTAVHATLQFEAGAALAVVYIRMKKYDLAELNCENVYRGCRKFLGKDHDSCYESLAVLAYIYDLQDMPARADTYRSMIPKDKQKTFEQKCRELFQGPINETTQETSIEDNRDTSISEDKMIELGSKPICYTMSSQSMILAYSPPAQGDRAEIVLHKLPQGNFLRILLVERDTAATCLDFDYRGEKLASGHGGRNGGSSSTQFLLSIRVWNAFTGQMLHFFTGHWGEKPCFEMTSIAFTPTGDRLISTYDYHKEPGWRQKKFKPGFTVQQSTQGDVVHRAELKGCQFRRFSMDGSLVIFRSPQPLFHVYNLKNLVRVGEPLRASIVCFNKNNNILELLNDCSVRIWHDQGAATDWLGECGPFDRDNRILNGSTSFTTNNDLIIVCRTRKANTLYLVMPQLGLLREIEVHTSHITWIMTEDGKYILYPGKTGPPYYLHILDIEEQMKLAEEIPPAIEYPQAHEVGI